ASALENFVAEIFVKSGCSGDEGRRIAKYLVSANLTGHDSHGVVRVPRYVQMKSERRVVPDQKISVLVDTPTLAVVDGCFGFGQTVAPQAVELGIAKCREHGLAAVALRNAGHIGRVGDWAAMAADAGLISVHFVNAAGSVLVAPFDGVDRRFSTAPFCVGIPRAGGEPVILDFATSVVAEGKVLVACRGGKKLPGDALVGSDGSVSGDPHLLYGDYEPAAARATMERARERSAPSASTRAPGSLWSANCSAVHSAAPERLKRDGRSRTACCRSIWIPRAWIRNRRSRVRSHAMLPR